MKKVMESKTNVMRILERNKVDYQPHTYDPSVTEGIVVASLLGEKEECVFKTLVTASNTGDNYVFVVPVAMNLDLKKAAAAVFAKSVAMIKQKQLLPLTGYVHGGCSPIGMKKLFHTVIDTSAVNFRTIYVSAGRLGCQIELDPHKLADLVHAVFADIAVR